MSPSLIQVAALAFALVSPAASVYLLDPSDDYSGATFFDNFNFFTGNDPTGGFVNYVSEAQAAALPLIGYNSGADRSFIGVDSTNVLSSVQTATFRGRNSVRLESKKAYTRGLFVAEIFHMPQEACGVWPAFWTVNQTNYPAWGEVDILENINEQTNTLNALHTTPTCTIEGNNGASRMTGTVASYDCNDQSTTGLFGTSQSQFQGCASNDNRPGVYGSAFNARGGGTVVMEISSHWVKIWNFAPNEVPADITSGAPDTSTFPLPAFTTEGGDCSIPDHFGAQQIIFDTTFCGSYAGIDFFWQQTSCYKANPVASNTCAAYVAAHPQAFANAYWIINSVKVYQWF